MRRLKFDYHRHPIRGMGILMAEDDLGDLYSIVTDATSPVISCAWRTEQRGPQIEIGKAHSIDEAKAICTKHSVQQWAELSAE